MGRGGLSQTRVEGRAPLIPFSRCRAAGSLRSAMAPPPQFRPPRPSRLLLLLLTVALLGSQARAEPAAGSAVPAQSKCRAPGLSAQTPFGRARSPASPLFPGGPRAPPSARLPLRP